MEKLHTTKEANKYFAKLKYIIDNFEKLEKRMKKIEERLTLMENIKELNRNEIYQLLGNLDNESRLTNDIKRLEEIIKHRALLYQTIKEIKEKCDKYVNFVRYVDSAIY